MKRIKRYILPIFIIVLILAFIIHLPVKADSGFDSDYDSGSSWSSGSSSHSSGSSSNHDSLSGNYNSDILIIVEGVIFFTLGSLLIENKFPTLKGISSSLAEILAISILFIVYKTHSNSNVQTTLIYSILLGDIILGYFWLQHFLSNKSIDVEELSLEEIKKELGEDFDYEIFKKLIFNNYKEIQIAWMDNDIERVRGLLSDTLFNTYKTQLLTLSSKKQKNMMEDIEYIECSITNINKKDEDLAIETLLVVTCRDYIVDIDTNKVLRGDKQKINKYYYKLIFTKTIKELDYKYCPNCGAELESGSSVKCPYCKSVIVKKSNDYVLTDKKMLKQE